MSARATDREWASTMTRHIDPVKLAELVSEGLSDRELAEIFSCDPRTILRRRQAHGLCQKQTALRIRDSDAVLPYGR